MSSQDIKPQRSKHRYRISGTPSRLGCVTCKIRRVKCGEEKPHCLRCISTGRKCDGYAPSPPKLSTAGASGSTLLAQATSISRSQSRTRSDSLPSTAPDSLDSEMLSFFCSDTVKSLSQGFWPDFWQSRVKQGSDREPSVRHAVIAIAALHRDFDLKAAGLGEGTLHRFAFKEYTRAISHLHRMMSGLGSQFEKLDITLISCILFVCFDFLVGNHSSAIIHLTAGLKIIKALPVPSTGTCHRWKTEFAPILLTLGVESAIFIRPLSRKRHVMHELLTTLLLPTEKSAISSLEDGKYKLAILHAQAGECETAIDEERWQQNFNSWIQAFDSFTSQNASEDPRWRRNTLLLQISALLISAIMSRRTVMREKHDELLDLCGLLISTRPNIPSVFTMTHDVIHPLFITALFTPDLSVQLRILELLKLTSGREGAYSPDDAINTLDMLIGRGEQLPLIVLNTGDVAIPTRQNDAIWTQVTGGVQRKMHWVGEDSPVGEDVIEVGRFEGSEFGGALEVEMDEVFGSTSGGGDASSLIRYY